jgi:hypothetical protein
MSIFSIVTFILYKNRKKENMFITIHQISKHGLIFIGTIFIIKDRLIKINKKDDKKKSRQTKHEKNKHK